MLDANNPRHVTRPRLYERVVNQIQASCPSGVAAVWSLANPRAISKIITVLRDHARQQPEIIEALEVKLAAPGRGSRYESLSQPRLRSRARCTYVSGARPPDLIKRTASSGHGESAPWIVINTAVFGNRSGAHSDGSGHRFTCPLAGRYPYQINTRATRLWQRGTGLGEKRPRRNERAFGSRSGLPRTPRVVASGG
jgi:hypothetical protein